MFKPRTDEQIALIAELKHAADLATAHHHIVSRRQGDYRAEINRAEAASEAAWTAYYRANRIELIED